MTDRAPAAPTTGELRALRMTARRLAGLVEAGDTAAVRAAVEARPRLLASTVERGGQDGWTPLHVAVAADRREVVDLLLDAGADLEATTEHGRTPLHVALEFAPGLVDLLLARGAEPDGAAAAYLGDTARLAARLDSGQSAVRDRAEISLLGFAAMGGSVDTVALLLDRGADPDDGSLRLAAAAGHPEVVSLLLGAGARVGTRELDTGHTALHAAVAAGPDGGRLDVVRLLLARRGGRGDHDLRGRQRAGHGPGLGGPPPGRRQRLPHPAGRAGRPARGRRRRRVSTRPG